MNKREQYVQEFTYIYIRNVLKLEMKEAELLIPATRTERNKKTV